MLDFWMSKNEVSFFASKRWSNVKASGVANPHIPSCRKSKTKVCKFESALESCEPFDATMPISAKEALRGGGRVHYNVLATLGIAELENVIAMSVSRETSSSVYCVALQSFA